MATVQVRYIVNDVDAAIAFYCRHLGFTEVMHPAPAFAMLEGRLAAGVERPEFQRWWRTIDARRHEAIAGRLEPLHDRRDGHRGHGGRVAGSSGPRAAPPGSR